MRSFVLKSGVFGLALLGLSCCDDREAGQAPLTAEEMYERAQELIKPSADRAASDFRGALEWTQKAAEAGYLQAQTDLGALYMYGGKGVKRDAAAAWKWFSAAAAQGSKEAELFLGDLLSRGEGVTRDVQAAAAHWRTAAEAGIAEAQYRLGHYLLGLGQQSAEGVEWLRRAARDGAPDGVREACRDLGYLYARGQAGVQADAELAAHWYGLAAERGEARAQLVYGLMLMEGEGIVQDAERGMAYIRMAAGQDYVPAIRMLIGLLQADEHAGELSAEIEAWMHRLEALQSRGGETDGNHGSSTSVSPEPAASSSASGSGVSQEAVSGSAAGSPAPGGEGASLGGEVSSPGN